MADANIFVAIFLFFYSMPFLRPRSNVKNILGIFLKLLHKSAAAHGQNIPWNILLHSAFCYVFIPLIFGIF